MTSADPKKVLIGAVNSKRRLLELSVILPTHNEHDNVQPILESLARSLEGISYEVIFVDDDSRDGTADLVRHIALTDPKVRIIHRVNRRGLSSACIEGMMSSAAPYVAVMDADLQHDESILPAMLAMLKEQDLDIVVGSRNVEGGSMGQFSKSRVALSILGQRLSRMVCGVEVHDPMSGFFILRRPFLLETVHRVSGLGFKILVDLLASCPRPVRLGEVPYTFRNRQRGESKLDLMVGIEYFQLLIDKLVGDLLPPPFVMFSLVGAIGVLIHLSVQWSCLFAFHASFRNSQIAATIVAMTVNFLLNNVITYRDRRLKGWRILSGLITFYVACSVGFFINLRVAAAGRDAGWPWYLAGLLGLVLSSVWNYGVTSIFTWRHVRRITEERALARSAAAARRVPTTPR